MFGDLYPFCFPSAPIPRVATDDPSPAVLGDPFGKGDGSDSRVDAIHDHAVTDIDAHMTVGVTRSGVGTELGRYQHSDLYLGQVRRGTGGIIACTISLMSEDAVAVSTARMTGCRIDAARPSCAKTCSRPTHSTARVHDVFLPLLGTSIILTATRIKRVAETVLELLGGHAVETRDKWIGFAD